MDRARIESIKDHTRGVRGIARREHFASGGDLASWRGRHSVRKDKRKESSRLACRVNNDKETT